MKWFKYIDVFVVEGKIEHWIHKQTVAVPAVMCAFYRTVVVMRELWNFWFKEPIEVVWTSEQEPLLNPRHIVEVILTRPTGRRPRQAHMEGINIPSSLGLSSRSCLMKWLGREAFFFCVLPQQPGSAWVAENGGTLKKSHFDRCFLGNLDWSSSCFWDHGKLRTILFSYYHFFFF